MKKLLLLFILMVSILAFGVACGSNEEKPNIEQNSNTTLKTMDVSLSSKSFDYDGEKHFLTIEGALPDKAIVVWQNNSLIDVGSISVFANIRCAGYKEANLSANLTIVGQDMSNDIALKQQQISIGYGAEYSFELSENSILPANCSKIEKYIDLQSGEILDKKPNYGGSFKYILQLTASGYNSKTLEGMLEIERSDVSEINIVNLPFSEIHDYIDTPVILPTLSYIPEYEILPKGHKSVEGVSFSSSDESIIKYENGEFVSTGKIGECNITISIDGTSISNSYTFVVPNATFLFEDFEDKNKELFVEQYVMEENEKGQLVPKLDNNGQQISIPKDPAKSYYSAYSSSGTESSIIDIEGNRALRVKGIDQFVDYYSFFEITEVPSGGWVPGMYYIEMDVSGNYPYTFYWIRNQNDVFGYYLMANSGTKTNGEAIIEDNKIKIIFNLTASDLGDTNVIRFAASKSIAFDIIIDNIKVIKVK